MSAGEISTQLCCFVFYLNVYTAVIFIFYVFIKWGIHWKIKWQSPASLVCNSFRRFCQQRKAKARLSGPMERFMCRRGSSATAGPSPSSSSGRPLCRNSWLMSTRGGERKAAGTGKWGHLIIIWFMWKSGKLWFWKFPGTGGITRRIHYTHIIFCPFIALVSSAM